MQFQLCEKIKTVSITTAVCNGVSGELENISRIVKEFEKLEQSIESLGRVFVCFSASTMQIV